MAVTMEMEKMGMVIHQRWIMWESLLIRLVSPNARATAKMIGIATSDSAVTNRVGKYQVALEQLVEDLVTATGPPMAALSYGVTAQTPLPNVNLMFAKGIVSLNLIARLAWNVSLAKTLTPQFPDALARERLG